MPSTDLRVRPMRRSTDCVKSSRRMGVRVVEMATHILRKGCEEEKPIGSVSMMEERRRIWQ